MVIKLQLTSAGAGHTLYDLILYDRGASIILTTRCQSEHELATFAHHVANVLRTQSVDIVEINTTPKRLG